MPCLRTVPRIVVLVVAALGVCAVAHAQYALDGFNPGANDVIWSWAIQPDGKILVAGDFTTIGGGGTGLVGRNRIARINPDGAVDAGFDPGADGPITAVTIQADRKILVAGGFTMLGGGGTGTTVRDHIGRLNADGSLDMSFNAKPNADVSAIAIQPDGRLLIGGAFTTIGLVARNNIARLNADGSLDPVFNPGANDAIKAMVLQPNGQLLVGGFFTMLGGGTGTTTRNRIGRLNADGSLDASFNPGTDNAVYALARQPDGKILIGGAFATIGGGGTGTSPRNRIARLNADGSVDTSFNPGANGSVLVIATQPDGRILAGGAFTTLGGGGTGTTTHARIGRLNANGSIDASFAPVATDVVLSLALQPDGKILAGGSFLGLNTVSRNHLGRLYTDGSLDADFNPGANADILAITTQSDGKIVVGGLFTTLGGGGTGTTARNRIGRLTAGGQLDTGFNPGANGQVLALAAQPDCRTVAGGTFSTLGGGGTGTTERISLGRLNADGSLDTAFNPGSSGIVYAMAVQPDGKIVVAGKSPAHMWSSTGASRATCRRPRTSTATARPISPSSAPRSGGGSSDRRSTAPTRPSTGA